MKVGLRYGQEKSKPTTTDAALTAKEVDGPGSEVRGMSAPSGSEPDDLAMRYMAFHAKALEHIAARARILSGCELKVVLHLVKIANPYSQSAESSAEQLAEHFRTDEKQIRRALRTLASLGMVQRGGRSGYLTIFHLTFLPLDIPVKMTGIDDGDDGDTGQNDRNVGLESHSYGAIPVKMTGIDTGQNDRNAADTGQNDRNVGLQSHFSPIPVKMTGIDTGQNDRNVGAQSHSSGEETPIPVKMTGIDTGQNDRNAADTGQNDRNVGVQSHFPDMVLGIASRARVESIRFDYKKPLKKSVDSIRRARDICERVFFTAKPTDFDPELIASASLLMHSYSAKRRDKPWPDQPDNEIVSQFLAVAEWPCLQSLLDDLTWNRKLTPGATPAWLVTVAVHRIHGIKANQQNQIKEELRQEKALSSTRSRAAPAEDYRQEIQKLARAKGM